MNLWSSFSSSSVKEWESKIKKDLKVSSIEDLNWKTSYGSINPIAKTNSQLSIHKTSKLNEICWRFDNENCNNKEILNHLSNGVNSINVNSQKFKESLFNFVPLLSTSKILLSVKILLSPVSARIINSCERFPPIGPVSAAIGIAVRSNLLNVFKYDKKNLLYENSASSSDTSKE